MSDIATISLKVNTSELERGNQELDKFQTTATGAAHKADDLNSVFRAGAQSGKQHNQTLKEQQQELQNLLNRINPTNKAFEELDKIYAQLTQANKKGLLPTEQFRDYGAILDDTRNKIQRTHMSLTEEGRALLEQEAAAKRAAQAGESFVSSLQEQASAVGKTRAEILEMKAAQLGVADQSAPFIAKIREQEEAWKRGEISAGQYRMAMRQLPMQITDVVTSLASGMPVYMVAIQQGGQIRDSFGGIGNALKAVTSIITPARIAMGGLVGVAGLVAYAWYKGAQEVEEFNKQLILTGNYAGKTAAQLNELARAVSGGGVTQYAAASALAQVVGSGRFRGEQLETVTRAAVAMEQATGQAVDKTISNFQKLYDSPTKASEELNKTLHYLTAAQFEYISALERRGDKEEAGQYAADAYSKAEQQRAQAAINNLGLIESAIRSATNRWKEFWDAALNIGRPQTEASQLEQVNKTINQIYADREKSGRGDLFSEGLKNLLEQKKQLEFVIKSQEGYNKAQAEFNKVNDDGIQAQSVINRYLDAGTTAAEKRTLAQKELNKAIADNAKAAKAGTATLWTSDDIEKARAGIEKLYKDPKTPKAKGFTTPAGYRAEETAQAELLTLQAQLKTLREHTSVNDVISQQRKDLWEFDNKITVLQEASGKRQLSAQETSLLAHKEATRHIKEQLAVVGDQIEKQKKLNSLLDSAQKLQRQQEAKRAEIALLATGISSRDAQRGMELTRVEEEYKLNPEAQAKALAEMRKTYEAQDSLERNWRAGAVNGLNEYLQTAQNVYSSVSQAAQTALGGISDMMTSLVTTGTASFKQFAASILKMIVEIINKLLVAWAVQKALGWISGAFNPQGGGEGSPSFVGPIQQKWDGGYTGDGGKFEPKGFVHGGEFVFTKEATSALGVGNLYALMRNAQGYADGGFVGRAPMYGLNNNSGAGGSAPVINTVVNVEANGNATAQTSSSGDAMGRALADEMQNAATRVIQRHLKPGGMIYNFSKGR
ncbi:phage tail tape measure protein [Enterobacter ludwigii]|uniref:phage tail tape measure protein n=1 Tax=Enterobacter ludwigii TaxID=299767 RepID=UPI002A802AAD|nr:phage tail tape measure protein [Enterobacter ludwigii]